MLIPIKPNASKFLYTYSGALSKTGHHTYLVPSSIDANIIDIWDKSKPSVDLVHCEAQIKVASDWR